MSSGQWTVLGLLVLLVGLEVIRSKKVHDYLLQIYANFKTNTQPPKI